MNWRVTLGVSCPLSVYIVVYFTTLALPYGVVVLGISGSIISGVIWGITLHKDNL